MVLVPTEENHSCSTVHSRAGECHGGLLVKAPKRQDGLGVRTHHFQLYKQSVGSTSGGSLCNTLSKQLPRFFSWRPDPETEATDAFAQSWTNIQVFAHPPWCLISRVLRKVQADKETVVLITPLWHTQPWFPVLMDLLVDYPLLLPKMEGVIRPSPNCDCPIQGLPPQLVTWRAEKISDQATDAKGVHPFSSAISDVLDFSAEKYAAGLEYRSLNCYRSALSSALLPVDGFQVAHWWRGF